MTGTRRPQALAITGCLGFGQAVAFASSFYLLGVLADPLAADLGMPASWLFVGMSVAFLVSAMLGPWGGRWIDARGGRQPLIVSNIAFATSLGALALSSDELSAALSVASLGFGMAIGLYSTPFAILVRLYGHEARAAITAVSLLGAAGGALGWPITQAAIDLVGWRGACLGWSAVHLFACAPLEWAILPKAHGSAAPRSVLPTPVVWDLAMVRLAVIFAGAWTLSTAMSAHMPRLLRTLGVEPDAAVATAALMGASAIGVRLVFLVSHARVSPIVTTRIATLLHPAGAVLALCLGPLAAAALPIGQGAGNGLLSVASGILPLVVFGSAGYAYRSALVLTPARFLQAIGPTALGVALQQSPVTALMMSTAVCVMMFAATFGLREGPSDRSVLW